MENEPDIVRELKEAERLGLLKSLSQTVIEEQKSNSNEDGKTVLFKNDTNKINKNTEKGSIENKDSLIESEELYRTIFENSAVAITVTDENEKIISWNKYTEKLLNLSEKDLFLKPVETLYPPKEWKKIRKENVRQKGMQHHLETKILKKGKKPIDIDISISVLKNNKGSIIGSIGVFKDITEKKRIEDELVESENRFRDIFDSTSDFLLYIEKGIILDINKTAEKIGGLKKDKIVGKKLSDLNNLFTKEDMKNHLQAEKNASCGASVRDYESDLISKDGTIRDDQVQKRINSVVDDLVQASLKLF